MSVQHIQPPYTKVILDVEGITAAQSAIVYLGTLPIRASVQLNISSGASSVKTFKDGVLASGTVTVTDYTLATGTTVEIGGTALVEGVAWTAGVSNDATADSLATAIDGLAAVQAANPAAAIITVKAATVGTAGNAITTTVSGTGVTVQQATLAGGIANAIDGAEFTITLPAHGMSSGLKVNYDVSAGTTLDNLVDNTDYWVLVVDANTIQLAATDGGAAIEIAAADDAVGGGTFTLTPATLDVDTTIQGSNDGITFVTLPDSTDTSTSAESLLFQYPTPTFAYLKVLVEPNDSEADVEVLLHTKL